MVVAIIHLLNRNIHTERAGATLFRFSQQATIAAADIEQAKARPGAANLIKKIVDLSIDSILKRLVRRLIFAIGQIPYPSCFGDVRGLFGGAASRLVVCFETLRTWGEFPLPFRVSKPLPLLSRILSN